VDVTAILSPEVTLSQGVFITEAILTAMVPFFTDLILLVRVLAVYPPRDITRLSAVVVYLPISCMKIGRLINFVLFWSEWFPLIREGGNPIIVSQEAWNRPYEKIEWILQVLDNGYSSALFLWRLRRGRSTTGRVESRNQKTSYSARINSLFWIAISNFVFPVILSFAQLVFAFKDRSFLDGGYVLMMNVFVQIIGVLLATVWSAGFKWTENHDGTLTTATLSVPRFAQPTFMKSGTSGSGTVVNDSRNAASRDRDIGIKLETFTEVKADDEIKFTKRFP